jgi:sulfur carrier protein ThiS
MTGRLNQPPGTDRLTEVQVRILSKSGHEVLPDRTVRLPEGTTVEGLLVHLSGLCGFDVRQAIVEERSYFLMINDSFCVPSASLDRRLRERDSVAVLPVVAGG